MLPSRFAQPTPIFTQRVRVFRSSLGSGYSTIARTLSRFVVPFVSLIVRSCPGARRARRERREEQRPCPRQPRGITADASGTEVHVRPEGARGGPRPRAGALVHRPGRREERGVA